MFVFGKVPESVVFPQQYIFQVSGKPVYFTHFPLQSSGQVILRGSKINGNVGKKLPGLDGSSFYNQGTVGVTLHNRF